MSDTVLRCYVAKHFGVPEIFIDIIRKESSTNLYFTVKDSASENINWAEYIIGQIVNNKLGGIDIKFSFKLYKNNEIDRAIHELSFNNDLNEILKEDRE